MAHLYCTHCSALIPEEDVNISEGIAFCRACDQLSKLSDIVEGISSAVEVPHVDLTTPPSGCRIDENINEIVIRASARSIGKTLGALFVAGFWNSIVSIFVGLAVANTLAHLGIKLPSWIPKFQSSGSASSMPLFMLIFLWIFLTPFILIGFTLLSVVFTSAFGTCRVRIKGSSVEAFTGVGPIGWKRRFDLNEIKSVKLGKTTWTQNDQSQPCIVIETDKIVRFASILTDTRRKWMAGAMKSILAP